MNRGEYVAALRLAAVSIGKRAVMNRLASELPKLFAGAAGKFLNPIIGILVEKILTFAITEGELGAFFLYIDMRIDSQAEAFEKAALDHFKAQQSGDPLEVKRAEEILKKEFAAFVVVTN